MSWRAGEKFWKKTERKSEDHRKTAGQKIWLKKVFEQEYQLGYVMELSATEKVTEKEAAKVCSQLAGKFRKRQAE